ncbi:hypothetical protein SCUCBS95973_003833 [Sporothrix curviconia]|uniref:Rhodopsin domain-containing protein n=1 Tax=Sporothrix curviconia TaxID=1260050 RepID=A0ABP0BIT7_9PEZI
MAANTQFNFTAYLEQPMPWQNQPDSIRGIIISVTSIAVLCAMTRLYIRLAVLRVPGWDDLFVVLYLLTTITSAAAVCIAPTFGLGQHLIMFTPPELRMFLILFYIGNASYVSSTAFMKLALLFQFLRVFQTGENTGSTGSSTGQTTGDVSGRSFLRRICQVLIVIVAVWGATFSFLAWVPCLPVSTYWDAVISFSQGTGGRSGSHGTCYGFGISTDRTAFIAHTAINMALDICVLAVPIPLYLGSRPTRHDTAKAATTIVVTGTGRLRIRAGIIVLLLLGALVNVVAAWRLALLIGSGSSVLETYVDSTFYAPDTVLLASLEVNLSSICASVPIFWPVLRQQVFRILVTKEVEITRDEHGGGSTETDSSSGYGSDDEMGMIKTKMGRTANSNGHYGDSFIRDQVDPLRPGTSAVETNVRSETAYVRPKRWMPWS